MITLVTGSPGGGKSLYVVSKLIPVYLLEGRTVYTNIKDLKYYSEIDIHGQKVRKNLIKVKDDLPVWEKVLPLPDDLDWRNLPNGSVIIYDEAQQFFPASGRTGLSSDGRISDLDTHRHKGYDLVYITQHPTLIDSHIRKFVSYHIHLYRKMGARRSVLYEWNHCVSSPENIIGDTESYLRTSFSFDKKSFQFYKSSEIHTVKFRLPKKFIYMILGFVALFSLVGYFIFVSFGNYEKLQNGDLGVSLASNSVFSERYLPSSSSVHNSLKKPLTPDFFDVKGYSCKITSDGCSCSQGDKVVNVPKNVCYDMASS